MTENEADETEEVQDDDQPGRLVKEEIERIESNKNKNRIRMLSLILPNRITPSPLSFASKRFISFAFEWDPFLYWYRRQT